MSEQTQAGLPVDGYASGGPPPVLPDPVVEYYQGEAVRQVVVVAIEPFGKARPRVTQNGTYMAAEYRKRKQALRRAVGPIHVQGLLKLTIVASRPMPAGWSQAQQRMMLGEPARPAPDLDNIVGAVMDALFPASDNHIVSLEAHKVWGERGQIEITIEKMGDAT